MPLIDVRLLTKQGRTLSRRASAGDVRVLVGATMVTTPLAHAPLMARLLAMKAFALCAAATTACMRFWAIEVSPLAVRVDIVKTASLALLLGLDLVVGHVIGHFAWGVRVRYREVDEKPAMDER